MICGTDVLGYSLRENTWGYFSVDALSDVSFDAEAFDSLLLPEPQKQQILSLVRVHENKSFSFNDLVMGKGKGMIFLLYGEPGGGKTLTAGTEFCPVL